MKFDKIYCLHCVEDTKRYNNMINQFNHIGLDVTIWETCRQPHMDIIFNGFLLSQNIESFNKPNEYNCTREHYTIIKTAYLNGYENILIFEDDIYLLNDKELFNKFIDNIPEDYDIIRLGGSCDYEHQELVNLYKNENIYWTKLEFGLWGTFGYGLSRKGMKYYIDYIDNIMCSADTPLFVNTNIYPKYGQCKYKYNELNHYISTIPLCYVEPNSFDSTIGNSLTPYNFYKSIDKSNYYLNIQNNIVLYIAHFIDEFSISQYNKLKSELPINFKLVWWLDNNCKTEKPLDIDFIEFDHNTIFSAKDKFNFFNPFKSIELFYEKTIWFREFKYYWIVEYDVYFNGNWKDLFITLQKYDDDLIASHIYKCDKEKMMIDHYEQFLPDKFYIQSEYEIFKGCLSFLRISNKGLKCIVEHNTDDIKSYLYEIYLPTILFKNNLSLMSITKFRVNNDDNINYYSDCEFIDDYYDFYCSAIFTDKSQMNKPNKLYTRYKPN